MNMPSTKQTQEDRKDYGRIFEEEVKSFLEDKFKFEDVKSNIHIGKDNLANEVDVCGRFQNILFIFQCRAAGKRSSPSLKEKIHATESRSKMVLENYKKIPEYSHCKFVIFILITKKIDVSDEDLELLSNLHPKIWYANEDTLEYYADLYDKIGEYAVYNFLADFEIRPPITEQLQLTTLRTKLGKFNVFSFYVRPKQLLKFSYVARRRSRQEAFYQRMLEKSRIKNIQKFLDNGGVFPTNIIIAIKDGELRFDKIDCTNLSKDIEVGTLTIKNSYNACWIIDGQHRLYSFAKSASNALIPCIAFSNTNDLDERGFFISINKKQKPIQPDLLWDLEGEANPNTIDGIVSNIVKKVSFEEPFTDSIYIPIFGSKAGKSINMAAFCNGIINSKIINRITPNCTGQENPLIKDYNYEDNHKSIVNRVSRVLGSYFRSLSLQLTEEHHKRFIFGNAGIPIMLYLLEPIVSKIGRIPSYPDLEDYTKIIAKYFNENYSTPEEINKLKTDTNSEGARRKFTEEIGLFIRKEIRDKTFWPKMEEQDYRLEIAKMERRIGKFIANKLSAITIVWEKQRVPETIYKIAKKRMESEGTDFDEEFDLGDEWEIIKRNDNWDDVFKKVFIIKNGFINKEELDLAFKYLCKIRNPESHYKSTIPAKEELDQANLYLKRLNKIIPESIGIEESTENNDTN